MKRLQISIVIVLTLAIAGADVYAGGPLGSIGSTITTYPAGAFPIIYRTDQGLLGVFSNADAVAMAKFGFDQWGSLPTSSLGFTNGGQLDRDVLSGSDPYISGINQFTDGVFPVVFDSDGSITDDIIGQGARLQVNGFAGSVALNNVSYNEGYIIINGVLTGNGNEANKQRYREVITHELGHLLGIGHSQIGLAGDYPLMYPYTTVTDAENVIAPDDAVAMSMLYPVAGYLNTVGSISGTLTTVGGAPLSGVNVVAVHSVTRATYSTVTDYFSGNHPRYISGPQPTGLYTLQGLPPGDYYIRIEPVKSVFTNGSVVASYIPPINPDVYDEWYNGNNESGDILLDNHNEKTPVSVSAGGATDGINIIANSSLTTSALIEHNGGTQFSFAIPNNSSVGRIVKYATRFSAPTNGSLVGIKFYVNSFSELSPEGTVTVSVHPTRNGSIAGTPGNELGSVTIPMSDLSVDQDNTVWLRGIGASVNVAAQQDFHVVISTNGLGRLNLAIDNGMPTENRSSYYVEATGWHNFPEGFNNGSPGYNLVMEAIYSAVPAGSPVPIVSLSPGALSFGKARTGVKTTRVLMLTNYGIAQLNVSGLSITGTNMGDYSVESGGGAFVLESGQTRQIVVGFTPGADGPRTGLLQIGSNAPTSPNVIALAGIGGAPIVNELITEVDFGEQDLDGSYELSPHVIKNTGSDTLSIMMSSINGTDAGSGILLLSTRGPVTILPNQSHTIRVQFKPRQAREYNATVRIVHNGSAGESLFPVMGIGKGADTSTTNVPGVLYANGVAAGMLPIVPNPAQDKAEIVCTVSGNGQVPVTLQVADIAGKIVATVYDGIVYGNGGDSRYLFTANLANLASGEYQVILRSQRGVLVQKLVIVR